MLKKLWLKLNKTSEKGIGIAQWIIFALISALCFVFFCHQDILITAGHSVEYLNGHIADFYSACYKTDGTYGANYLPSTFILFAIWNVPMKLFGFAPEFFGDWGSVFTFWNKLLPTTAYFLSSLVLYKIVTKHFGFDKRKATITVFLMVSSPLAFFSQFLFCQYDILTVLFMLIGMYFYFKKEPSIKDYIAFSLFFGIATSFKYFALIAYAVLLLLRIKDILKAILLAIVSILPVGIEAGFYILTDRGAFIKSVFNFTALDYTEGFVVNLGQVSINLMYVVLIAVIAFAYFTKADDYEELVGYGMFYCTGVCFALFGMMFWHSQWLIFAVPFMVLSTVLNRNYKALLCVEALQGVVFLVYIVNMFKDTVADQCLFRYGVLNSILNYKQVSTLKMCDLFVYKNTETLFSLLCASFLVIFIFSHPKFNFDKINEALSEGRVIINIRFLAFTLAFITGAFVCLPNFAERPENLWRRFGGSKQEIVEINNTTYLDEYTKLDKMTVQYVYIVADDTDKEHKSKIFVDIIDTDSNEVVAHGEGKEKNIKKGDTENFTKLTLHEDFTPEQDKLYKFRFYTDDESTVSVYVEKNKNEASYLYRIWQKDYSECYAKLNESSLDNKEPVMRLTGKIK